MKTRLRIVRWDTKVNIPPIKSQGIKTKLVPWIGSIVPQDFDGVWIEPFMGTGVVAFNLAPRHALLCDANPHLVNFYQAIADEDITAEIVRDFLNREGEKLLEQGASHYYLVRERFNRDHQPLDFLFLNRAGFNGMIRFNRKGEFNILTREHFYHVGGREENRNPVVEAIVTNYDALTYDYPVSQNREQLMLLAKKPDYSA